MAAVFRRPQLPVRLAALAFVVLAAGCATFDRAVQRIGDSGSWNKMTGITERTFDAPITRVKPAVIATLSGMGMRISSLEVRGGREVIKATKAGSEVEVALESVKPASTRARIAANTGGLLYDDAAAARIVQQTEKRLGGA